MEEKKDVAPSLKRNGAGELKRMSSGADESWEARKRMRIEQETEQWVGGQPTSTPVEERPTNPQAERLPYAVGNAVGNAVGLGVHAHRYSRETDEVDQAMEDLKWIDYVRRFIAYSVDRANQDADGKGWQLYGSLDDHATALHRFLVHHYVRLQRAGKSLSPGGLTFQALCWAAVSPREEKDSGPVSPPPLARIIVGSESMPGREEDGIPSRAKHTAECFLRYCAAQVTRSDSQMTAEQVEEWARLYSFWSLQVHCVGRSLSYHL
jgi:hypothetical protein